MCESNFFDDKLCYNNTSNVGIFKIFFINNRNVIGSCYLVYIIFSALKKTGKVQDSKTW